MANRIVLTIALVVHRLVLAKQYRQIRWIFRTNARLSARKGILDAYYPVVYLPGIAASPRHALAASQNYFNQCSNSVFDSGIRRADGRIGAVSVGTA
jgi:hypothetical protein